jgi:hypothetical protein
MVERGVGLRYRSLIALISAPAAASTAATAAAGFPLDLPSYSAYVGANRPFDACASMPRLTPSTRSRVHQRPRRRWAYTLAPLSYAFTIAIALTTCEGHWFTRLIQVQHQVLQQQLQQQLQLVLPRFSGPFSYRGRCRGVSALGAVPEAAPV